MNKVYIRKTTNILHHSIPHHTTPYHAIKDMEPKFYDLQSNGGLGF